MTAAEEPAPAPRVARAMLVVMAPQTLLATALHGVSALGPALTAGAGLAPEAIGIVGGLVGLGSVWFFAASGAVLGPLGPARALFRACLLSAAATLAMLLGHPAALFLAAPLLGFAYAVTAPAGSAIVAEAAPRRLWGALFSIRMAGVPLGGALAGGVAASLAAAFGWRAGVLAFAAAPLLAALALAFAAGPWRGPRGGPLRLAPLVAPRALAGPFRLLAAAPDLRRLALASLGFATAQGAVLTFLTTVATERAGLSLALAGALFATLQGASVIGRIILGLLSARLGGPRRVLAILGPCSACACLAMALAGPGLPPAALFAAVAAIGAAAMTWNGLFLAEIAAAAPTGEVGEATAAVTFFTFIAYAATPPVFAAVALTLGWEVAYALAAAGAAAAGATLARAGPPA